MSKSLYIGLLSGTSLDAIDVALLDFSPHLRPCPQLLKTLSYPLPQDFKKRCLMITSTGQVSIDELGALDNQAGELFAAAALALLKDSPYSPSDILAIGSHGQNLRHQPLYQPPFTLQIGDPNIIAERTGIRTIADFRRRDIAAGGQGAPLAPGFHETVFRSETENRAIINIGGISNITILPKDSSINITGFDIGPGNCLMDEWTQKHWNYDFDEHGKYASLGKIHQDLLAFCLQDPFFELPPPKSTGREYFNLKWLMEKLGFLEKQKAKDELEFAPEDIQATLLSLTVNCILKTTKLFAPKDANIYLCGGGAHNKQLIRELEKQVKVQTTETLGIAPDWVEAALFAWLAKQTFEGKTGNCPSVTGAKRRVPLGGIYLPSIA